MARHSPRSLVLVMAFLIPQMAHSHQKPWYKKLWPWSGTNSTHGTDDSTVQNFELMKSSRSNTGENIFICRDGKYLYVERDGRRVTNSEALIFSKGAERCKCDHHGRDELQNRCEVR